MATDPTKVTSEEIAEYRTQFADNPEVLDALSLIEENEGDLEEAASLLAAEAGLEIERQMPILDWLALHLRNIICDKTAIRGFQQAGVATLAFQGQIPIALAAVLLCYLTNIGVDKWCELHRENTTNQ